MAEIINLRQQRKCKRRAMAERDAEANRVKHGTPSSLRDRIEVERARLARDLDGNKREP